MKTILSLLCLIAFICVVSADPKAFVDFVATYGKMYASDEEYLYRYDVFKDNLVRAAHMNTFEKDHETFGVTVFSDLTPTEFKRYLGYRPSKERKLANPTIPTFQQTPMSLLAGTRPTADTVFFDWYQKNATTPIYNQGDCGSCWAFSTTEEIESMWFLAGHNLTQLSMQQIMDCDTTDDGCGGGDTITAYGYVKSAGGLEPLVDYPYLGVDVKCRFKAQDILASIDGYTYVSRSGGHQNETAMLLAVQQVGPLSICVDAASWQLYKPGHIISVFCGHLLDHCVQLTGYGTNSEGTEYWNVRNSWGALWGNDGYLMVERNKNLCGIADEATYANIPAALKKH